MRRHQAAVCAALATAAVAVGGCGGASSPEGATKSFFQALSDGKPADACKLVPAGSRQEVFAQLVKGGAQDCDQLVDKLTSKQKKLYANVIADPSPDSAGRTIIARFEDDNGSPSVPYAVALAKSGDEYRIRAINEGGAP
jgi:hypothetical protein